MAAPFVSALDGSGLEDLRSDLNQAADPKAIVAVNLATEVDAIARAEGLEPSTAVLAATNRRPKAVSRCV